MSCLNCGHPVGYHAVSGYTECTCSDCPCPKYDSELRQRAMLNMQKFAKSIEDTPPDIAKVTRERFTEMFEDF